MAWRNLGPDILELFTAVDAQVAALDELVFGRSLRVVGADTVHRGHRQDRLATAHEPEPEDAAGLAALAARLQERQRWLDAELDRLKAPKRSTRRLAQLRAATDERLRELRLEPRCCVVCGAVLEPAKGGAQGKGRGANYGRKKYCGNPCREVAREARRDPEVRREQWRRAKARRSSRSAP